MFDKIHSEENFSFPTLIEDQIKELLKEEADLIETEIEKAIQGGRYGVKVTRSCINRRVLSVSVDHTIPYGMIHEVLIFPDKS